MLGSVSEVVDDIAILARLRVAEMQCHTLCDYFNLVQRFSREMKRASLDAQQKGRELISFLETASKLPIESALEIGTAAGGTFYLLCRAARSTASLLTIDLNNDWRRRVLLHLTCPKPSQKVHIIRGNSRDERTLARVKHALRSRELDILFIDGDHSFEGVRKDFELYSGLVRQGGIIAFHDIVTDYRTRYGIATVSSPCSGEVPRFWSLVKSKWRGREFVESRDQDGYGIGAIIWDSDSAKQ